LDNLAATEGLLPDLEEVKTAWLERVLATCNEATLNVPEASWYRQGGKHGIHSEHLSYMLAEMQVLPRTYPDAAW